MPSDPDRLSELSRSLSSAQGYAAALSTLVREISRHLNADNLLVWIYEEARGELCCEASRSSRAAGLSAGQVCPQQLPVLEKVLREGAPAVMEEPEQAILKQPILIDNIQVSSAIFAPLRNAKGVFGVLEAVAAAPRRLTAEDAALLEQFAGLAAPALLAWRSQGAEQSGLFRAVTRLTLLYDVSRSFHSTIQIDELLPILTNRTANVMDARACRLWLLAKGALVCESAFGDFRTVATEPPAAVREALESKARVLIGERGDPRLAGYGNQLQGGEARSVLCAPAQAEGTPLGVLEAINKQDGDAFTDADADLLEEVAGEASAAIRNAQRHEAEKKVKELQALLCTSREITSSLDLERVLAVIVNQSAALLPADRCVLGIESSGRYRIGAIAGEVSVNRKDPRVRLWDDLMDWTGQTGTPLYVSERGGDIDDQRPETREKLRAYFEQTGMRSVYSLPLKDDVGQVGVIVLESATPAFLSPSQIDLLQIFGSQATVAVRNAQLYKEVPLIGLLEPLAAKKRAFLALPQWKRSRLLAAAAALVASLIFVPWNVKVEGNAYVLPARTAGVSAEVAGMVEDVFFHEGDHVPAGAVIATLRPGDYLLKLDDARTRFDVAERERQRAEAAADTSRARIQSVALEQLRREIDFYRTNVERTRIRTPIEGMIVTPDLEMKRGRRMERGEVFCETAVIDPALVDVAVSEDDIELAQAGQEVWLKANAYPSRKFLGRAVRISPQAAVEQDRRYFVVTVEFENADHALRAGMLGKAKILTGSRSVGYAMLRKPAQWVERTIWQWTP